MTVHKANCPVGGNFACTCGAEDQLERHSIGVRGECEFEALETLICDLRACLKQIQPTMNPEYQGDTMRRISALLHGNSITNEIIDWKAAYYEALRQRDALTADAERYRFLRNHTWVEAYWIDGSGGVDVKIRVKGCVDHLDKDVDMERIKEPRVGSQAQRCSEVGK